jgi:predicted transcriptional regulator
LWLTRHTHTARLPGGILDVDHDDDRVRCHRCSNWWRHLATHARLAHGLYAHEYRALAGLHPRQPLVARRSPPAKLSASSSGR